MTGFLESAKLMSILNKLKQKVHRRQPVKGSRNDHSGQSFIQKIANRNASKSQLKMHSFDNIQKYHETSRFVKNTENTSQKSRKASEGQNVNLIGNLVVFIKLKL